MFWIYCRFAVLEYLTKWVKKLVNDYRFYSWFPKPSHPRQLCIRDSLFCLTSILYNLFVLIKNTHKQTQIVETNDKEKKKRKNSLFIVLSLVAVLLFPRSVIVGLKVCTYPPWLCAQGKFTRVLQVSGVLYHSIHPGSGHQSYVGRSVW